MTYTNSVRGAPPRDMKVASLHHDADALTEPSRRIWGAGDHDQIAAGFRHEAESLVWRPRSATATRRKRSGCSAR